MNDKVVDKKRERLRKLKEEFGGKFEKIASHAGYHHNIVTIEQVEKIEREPTTQELIDIADGFSWNFGGTILLAMKNKQNGNRQWRIKVYTD